MERRSALMSGWRRHNNVDDGVHQLTMVLLLLFAVGSPSIRRGPKELLVERVCLLFIESNSVIYAGNLVALARRQRIFISATSFPGQVTTPSDCASSSARRSTCVVCLIYTTMYHVSGRPYTSPLPSPPPTLSPYTERQTHGRTAALAAQTPATAPGTTRTRMVKRHGRCRRSVVFRLRHCTCIVL